jgi:hypothetical protein
VNIASKNKQVLTILWRKKGYANALPQVIVCQNEQAMNWALARLRMNDDVQVLNYGLSHVETN